MDYKLITKFIDSGREARLFLILATFLWAAILIGPFNIYFLLLAVGLSIRGLVMLAGWYSYKNEIKEYLNKELNNEIYETKKNEDDIENFKFRYESFSSNSLNQFGIILSIYPISLIAHYAEKNNFETLQTITYFLVVLLFMGVMVMGVTDIETYGKD